MNVEAVAAARRTSPAFFTRQAWVLCDLYDGRIAAFSMDINSIRRFIYGCFVEAGVCEWDARDKARDFAAVIRKDRLARGVLT